MSHSQIIDEEPIENKKKFELVIDKESFILWKIEKTAKLQDKSIFFQFNNNFIVIKDSLNETIVCDVNEHCIKYECSKHDEDEYEIKFNAKNFIRLLKMNTGKIKKYITLSLFENDYKNMIVFYEFEKEYSDFGSFKITVE
jgi:hypothetical protein